MVKRFHIRSLHVAVMVLCAWAIGLVAKHPAWAETTPAVAQISPGAEERRILETLWTPQELDAPATERRGSQGPATDAMPPARLQPHTIFAPLTDALRGNIRSVRLSPGRGGLIALTFDLCELADRRTGYDGDVVRLLRQADVRATFFAGGKWMRSHPERAMQLMADPLFELGNHGWTHGNLGVMPAAPAQEQILWAQAQYELLREELARRADGAGLSTGMGRIPQAMTLFRLPYGRCSPQALDMLAAMGLACVQWTTPADENASRETPQIRARRLAARVGPGSIVLMHANGVPRDTAAVLRELLPELARKGLTPVTVSELLAAGSPVAVHECYFERPGDNLALDAIYGDGTRRTRKAH